MKQIEELDSISKGQDILAGIDLIGNFKKLFQTPKQVPGCLFLLCTRGECSVTIHLTQHKLTSGSLAILFPEQFLQISEQTPDCRFIFTAFSQQLVHGSRLFSHTIEYTPSIYEQPVVQLSSLEADVFYSHFMLQIKTQRLGNNFLNRELISLTYAQIILGLGNIYKQNQNTPQICYNRNQEIVKELIRMVIKHYKTERNISFYAENMHLSPQHLSTTIKKITGKTLTDIISSFIIKDAQAKLRSTELTIQEIAYSLNFPDISFFGKYFKRYTGMSPKQYRNAKDI